MLKPLRVADVIEGLVATEAFFWVSSLPGGRGRHGGFFVDTARVLVLKRPASGLAGREYTLFGGLARFADRILQRRYRSSLGQPDLPLSGILLPSVVGMGPDTMAEPATTQTKASLKRASQRESPNENNGACPRTNHSRDSERARKIPSRSSINHHYRRIFPLSPLLWQCVIMRAVVSPEHQINVGSFEVRRFQRSLASVYLNISGAFPYK